MTTVLTIVLAVLIAANVWLLCYSVKREKQRRAKLQERMDECDETIGEMMNELGRAKQRLNEANSAKAALKKSFDETIAEYERLTRDYRRLQSDLEAFMQGKGVLLVDKANIPDGKTVEDIEKEWSNFNGKAEKPIKPKKKPARKAKK
jgi:chromosome segregation ATPase